MVETVGTGIMVIGGLGAFLAFLRDAARDSRRAGSYERLRRNLGRCILLGLEVLIVADIVRTVVVDQTFESVTVLGIIVLIRILLSFSLDVEIDGVWPWNRLRESRNDQAPSPSPGSPSRTVSRVHSGAEGHDLGPACRDRSAAWAPRSRPALRPIRTATVWPVHAALPSRTESCRRFRPTRKRSVPLRPSHLRRCRRAVSSLSGFQSSVPHRACSRAPPALCSPSEVRRRGRRSRRASRRARGSTRGPRGGRPRRDAVEAESDPQSAFGDDRRGIPHSSSRTRPPARAARPDQFAPDVLERAHRGGAEPQDVAARLHGEREPGDEDLVYLWVRRPIIEWALRRAAAKEPAIELRPPRGYRAHSRRPGSASHWRGPRGRRDVARRRSRRRARPLPRYRRVGADASRGKPDCGALYYCRYFELRDGVDHLDGGDQNPLNPRGDLGYMGFNTFRGDNRT